MPDRFKVDIKTEKFVDSLSDVQIVFHGVNKSGSLCMAKTLLEAYEHAGREQEFFSHYHRSREYSLQDFITKINNTNGPSFFVGHYIYGAIRPKPHQIIITQFRNPLPRILSCYQWIKNKHIRSTGTANGFPTLEQHIINSNGKKNSQISQFGIGFGERREQRLKKMSVHDIYEAAVDAVEREVYCIGIAEYFEESIYLFAKLCGLDSVAAWEQDKRNKGRPLIHEISQHERDLISEYYYYDFKLYEWAMGRFRSQLENIQFGPELHEYKNACSDQYKDRVLNDLMK